MNKTSPVREILEKVDGIAFSNGPLKDGTSWQTYRIDDYEKQLKDLIRKTMKKHLPECCKNCFELEVKSILKELFGK